MTLVDSFLDILSYFPVVEISSFDEGTGRIWLENVTCMGSERELIDCIDDFSGNSSCTHAQDAGVRCPSGMCFQADAYLPRATMC